MTVEEDLKNRLLKDRIESLEKEVSKNQVFINLLREENSHINKRITELKSKIKTS